ncbi:PREDICTED: fatty-acid-binding protein 2-like isoform X2 [Nelumbo nucifera]|uniref:Fatty-acid-binding protein 2-like isoform X2 n=1 Tax=Nelumbo nucifera TaxID=4432 RepID=A0A1U8A425_NELNU|nr:PREDICTED: fatty-acid-binding protein 2-like isoform X2 [Nelumbo nucifera]
MRNSWFFFLDLDGGSPYIYPPDPLVYQSFGGHLLSQISSFVDNSLHQSRYIYFPGSLVLQEAFNCFSKFAGALLFWCSAGSNSNIHRKVSDSPHGSKHRSFKSCTQIKQITSCRHNLAGLHSSSRSRPESTFPLLFDRIANSTISQLCNEVEQLQPFPMFMLAAALVPPFDKSLSPKVLHVPLENTDVEISGHLNQRSCVDEHRGCTGYSFLDMDWSRHAVEPRTGIKFPTILDNILAGEKRYSLPPEVLVGTGSRTMTIIKIKSLKLYAFGLYVHPDSVCEELDPKYASMSVSELNNQSDFFEDLLSAFEKSLQARLVKVNPNTDYRCLRAFGSYFSQDIPLPAGTTIDFRQTADGWLITEIAGKQIGSVHSKDLCRAFFDMYIGDVPVSVEAKEEIARNIASIIRRC